jgi:uncharacterized protein (TIGR02246 family)
MPHPYKAKLKRAGGSVAQASLPTKGAYMSRRIKFLSCLCALALIPTLTERSARARTPEVPTAEADQQAVRGWLGSYSASINAGDIVAFAKLWADGCDWAPPDAPMLSGKQAILEHARAAFQKHLIRHQFTDQAFKVVDGFAVAMISSAEQYTPKADTGVAFEQKVKGVVILNRNADGSWAATHFIWNRDAPSPR